MKEVQPSRTPCDTTTRSWSFTLVIHVHIAIPILDDFFTNSTYDVEGNKISDGTAITLIHSLEVNSKLNKIILSVKGRFLCIFVHLRVLIYLCFLPELQAFDFRTAVVKCLLVRNMDDDVFCIDGYDSYQLDEALNDTDVLSHFHLYPSHSWKISSIREFLQQHYPEMLNPSVPKIILDTTGSVTSEAAPTEDKKLSKTNHGSSEIISIPIQGTKSDSNTLGMQVSSSNTNSKKANDYSASRILTPARLYRVY